jgi:hypothetical protein
MSRRIESQVAQLYAETDITPASEAYPITPLGPLLERLTVRCEERPKLTLRSAEEFLRSRRVLQEPLTHGQEKLDARLSGFIYSDGRMARILVNADERITRRRFSIGHELGHFLLHCRPQADTLGTDAPFIDMLDLDAAGHTQREEEADAFAAALLMPTRVVLALTASAQQRGWRRDDLWREVAERMLVSDEAARRRLADLGVTR